MTRFQAIAIDAPAFDVFANHVRACHVNGGIVYARFRVRDVANGLPPFPDFPPDAFRQAVVSFLNSAQVRTSMPELGEVGQEEPTAAPMGFVRSRCDGLTLDGEFAHVLVQGGAYEHFKGKASEAKAVGLAAYTALFGERYSSVRVYRSDMSWSEFFFDVAYDVSWLVVDDTAHEVTLICITDTD